MGWGGARADEGVGRVQRAGLLSHLLPTLGALDLATADNVEIVALVALDDDVLALHVLNLLQAARDALPGWGWGGGVMVG